MQFLTPLLLIGLLAASIPFLLHLLSSVRAQEVYFPTLRFLRLSMEKTARRRRIQHWLLLLVRSALLALLCLSAAQPLTRAAGSWLGRESVASVIVLDNSYSMAVRDEQTTRLDRAKQQAAALLGGDDKPSLAALLTTNGGAVSTECTARIDTLRDALGHAAIGYGPAPLAQRVSAGLEMLHRQSVQRKAIYIFSDLQRLSFDDVLTMENLAEAKDVHLFVVNLADKPVNNVGLTDLEIKGRRVIDSTLELTGRLVNSSPTDRVVDVGLRIDGADIGSKMRLSLAAAGKDGHIATVRFHHAFNKGGQFSGELYIEQSDDLPADNVRRFCLDIGNKVSALVVRGPRATEDPWWLDAGGRLLAVLDPYAEKGSPWPIAPQVIEAAQFTPGDLKPSLDAVFFSDVPSFTPEQAGAIEKFVKQGGTAVFFLGPNIQADNYNQVLASSTETLAAKLGSAVGEVGATAAATELTWLDIAHPYLQGLPPWTSMADYLSPPVQVQRYFKLAASPPAPAVLGRLKNGDPLLLCKAVGAGRSVLCTTTSSPRWSNFSSQPLFLPLMVRISLLARQDLWRDGTYLADAQVPIRLGDLGKTAADAPVRVMLPPAEGSGTVKTVTVPARKTDEGYIATFDETARPGLYRWSMPNGAAAGQFAVNPHGEESKLETIPPAELAKALANRGLSHVYIGSTVAEVNAQAAATAAGHNWWDMLAAVAIVLLVAEAIIANRRKLHDDIIPAHLNPKIG